jgi:hypothetical protein
VKLSEAQRHVGATSQWVQWKAFGFDPSTRQVTLQESTITKYTGSIEGETSTLLTCRLEGSQMECRQDETFTSDNQPWYKEVDLFHMQRVAN